MQTNTFYDKIERRFYTVPALNRQNPYQVRRLTRRCLLQLREEDVSMYSLVAEEHIKAHKQSLYRRGMRCRVLPQGDGPAIVLFEGGNHKLPDSLDERVELIRSWIKNIPKGKRIRGDREFGGVHAGFYFPPKNPGRNIKINLEIWDVEMILDHDGVEHRKQDEDDIVIVEMGDEEAEKYVRRRLVGG